MPYFTVVVRPQRIEAADWGEAVVKMARGILRGSFKMDVYGADGYVEHMQVLDPAQVVRVVPKVEVL